MLSVTLAIEDPVIAVQLARPKMSPIASFPHSLITPITTTWPDSLIGFLDFSLRIITSNQIDFFLLSCLPLPVSFLLVHCDLQVLPMWRHNVYFSIFRHSKKQFNTLANKICHSSQEELDIRVRLSLDTCGVLCVFFFPCMITLHTFFLFQV